MQRVVANITQGMQCKHLRLQNKKLRKTNMESGQALTGSRDSSNSSVLQLWAGKRSLCSLGSHLGGRDQLTANTLKAFEMLWLLLQEAPRYKPKAAALCRYAGPPVHQLTPGLCWFYLLRPPLSSQGQSTQRRTNPYSCCCANWAYRQLLAAGDVEGKEKPHCRSLSNSLWLQF